MGGKQHSALIAEPIQPSSACAVTSRGIFFPSEVKSGIPILARNSAFSIVFSLQIGMKLQYLGFLRKGNVQCLAQLAKPSSHTSHKFWLLLHHKPSELMSRWQLRAEVKACRAAPQRHSTPTAGCTSPGVPITKTTRFVTSGGPHTPPSTGVTHTLGTMSCSRSSITITHGYHRGSHPLPNPRTFTRDPPKVR